jgi:hypothetical protein
MVNWSKPSIKVEFIADIATVWLRLILLKESRRSDPWSFVTDIP